MKLLVALLIALPIFSFAQSEQMVEAMMNSPEMKVEQQQIKWKKASYNAHTMLIHAEKGDVEKGFEEFLKKKYSLSFSKDKGMQAASGVVMADIIAETVTFAFKAEEANAGTRLSVIVDLGGTSLNGSDHPDATANLNRLMRSFAKSFYDKAYSEVISDEEKTLDKAEKGLAKSVKEGEKMVSSMEKNTNDIASAESDITKKTQEIEDLKAEIEKLKADIEQLKKDKANNEKEVEAKKKEVAAQKTRVTKLRQVADGLQR